MDAIHYLVATLLVLVLLLSYVCYRQWLASQSTCHEEMLKHYHATNAQLKDRLFQYENALADFGALLDDVGVLFEKSEFSIQASELMDIGNRLRQIGRCGPHDPLIDTSLESLIVHLAEKYNVRSRHRALGFQHIPLIASRIIAQILDLEKPCRPAAGLTTPTGEIE